ncbi:MAG: hypothetical protein HKM24_00900 [Gammaproteobacteria bacterium]|nr:hypothetical protein [Gammaproteobacteria bacterium]
MGGKNDDSAVADETIDASGAYQSAMTALKDRWRPAATGQISVELENGSYTVTIAPLEDKEDLSHRPDYDYRLTIDAQSGAVTETLVSS